MSVQSVIDQPVTGASYYRQRIAVSGWIFGDYRHDRLKRISAHAPTGEIGSTAHFFLRDDVTSALKLAPETRTGFRFVASFAAYPVKSPSIGIEIRAEFADGSVTPLAGIHVGLIENDFTGGAYGEFCNPQHVAVKHCDEIFAEGKVPSRANPECLDLLADYLPSGASVVDVRCGEGAYCEPVRQLGHSWLGCESTLDHLHALALHSRPHRAMPRRTWPWSKLTLPVASREFDAAICIDVLTRERDPHPLLAEIARATQRHAFFSVPNNETLPFIADRLVVPRHLLDPRQVNYFTRFSLRPLLQQHFRAVEILDYGRQPTATVDGRELPYHLFAICEV